MSIFQLKKERKIQIWKKKKYSRWTWKSKISIISNPQMRREWNAWKMKIAIYLTFVIGRVETIFRLHRKSALAINGFSVFEIHRPNLTHSKHLLGKRCYFFLFLFVKFLFCFQRFRNYNFLGEKWNKFVEPKIISWNIKFYGELVNLVEEHGTIQKNTMKSTMFQWNFNRKQKKLKICSNKYFCWSQTFVL